MFPSRYISLLMLVYLVGHSTSSMSQKLVSCDSFLQLENHIAPFLKEQQTVVINFWATWCGPCIEELPYFELLHDQYGKEKVKVVLVSLDFKSNYDKRVVPFVKEKGIKADVLHLTDMDANTWMPKVHPTWDGALPFTIVIRGDRRESFNDKFKNFTELENFVRPFLALNLLSQKNFTDSGKK